MYENMTFENIMSEILNHVSSSFDKREGSIIYDAVAPVAVELANAYIALDNIISETFADTASLKYLERRSAERGITRKQATKAILKGMFTPTTIEIPIGSRFSCEDLNYVVIEKIADGQYKLECENEGTKGNVVFGNLIPIGYIEGLSTATLTELLVPAIDAEGVSALRKRYFESISSQPYGGNIADYKHKVSEMSDVGGVKVIPTWNGGGTVKLIILDGAYGEPSSTLISKVKEMFDPTSNSGNGYGLAPIGHTVTVVGATQKSINMTCTITYASGWSWATASTAIKAAVDGYMQECAENWSDLNNVIVRTSQIETRILGCEGVIDVENLKIGVSGSTLSTSNITLAVDAIPKRGTINGNS